MIHSTRHNIVIRHARYYSNCYLVLASIYYYNYHWTIYVFKTSGRLFTSLEWIINFVMKHYLITFGRSHQKAMTYYFTQSNTPSYMIISSWESIYIRNRFSHFCWSRVIYGYFRSICITKSRNIRMKSIFAGLSLVVNLNGWKKW